MGGLEVSIINISSAFGAENPTCRVDAEFFRKEFLSLPIFSNVVGKASTVRSGTTPSDRDDDLTEGVILLKTTDIRNHPLNSSDTSSLYRISPQIADRMQKTKLCAGDVLINIVGATTDVIGRVAIVPKGFPEANITQAMALIRLISSDFSSETLFTFLSGKFGQAQVRRLARPTGQYNLNIPEVSSLRFPSFSPSFSDKISELVKQSEFVKQRSTLLLDEAGARLLAALDLPSWVQSNTLTYSALSSDALTSGRLDAQFFAPRIQNLIDHLSVGGKSVGSVCISRREKFNPTKHGDFNYIEISDLDGAGTATSSRVAAEDAASRATWFVRPGDIITSTVRPLRRLSAQIMHNQDGHVCSSGFVVLNPTVVSPELLLTYLRLPIICELMDLYSSASMYPAISEADLLALPFPAVDVNTDSAVVLAVQEGRNAIHRARALLDAAKRAVEIAIEDSEAAAVAYLDTVGA